ncbi:MAG: hypothetical protein IAI50_18985 [Candidatus Eremiobacteraeota bacterium]|nr:hypothetical protein [Candidatus Eremiobacteraeota bacterium]
MKSIRTAAVALVACAMLLGTPVASLAKPMSNTARFSKAPVYVGQPALATTVALIGAGGGAAGFDATKLVGYLAGDKASAEIASLQQKFGGDNVKSFLDVFNFAIADSVTKLKAAKLVLPATGSPAPAAGGKALAGALYTLGVNTNTNTFDAEYLLDELVSHQIHMSVMDDIDAKFGKQADANYHAVLAQTMMDLKAVYGL